MSFLKFGDKGAAVKRLQRALLDAGFDPGLIDGAFGAGTRAAVLAFQHSKGLVADGVAGPRTQSALGLTKSAKLPDATPRGTVQIATQMFPFTPLGNIKRHLPEVLAALKADDIGDRLMVLMALATIRAETESFEPIPEGRSVFNTSPNGHPFDLYDNRVDLGNRGKPDGERFKGRGFVQLTGRSNYRRIGKTLGLPLETQPDLGVDPSSAARILAAFLKSVEGPAKDALALDNLPRARWLVNGGSHGLDRFTDAYRRGERLVAPD
ncbi:MAG: peptidoglycan-binding protein [Alphaproteobacteria bacterium]|nr:peptidoglycan-binding protein [Alphaproteobacteria bacterium]